MQTKPTKPEPDGATKATSEEVRRRVDDVLQILLDGARYWDVLQFAAEKGWNVKERQLREYMHRAYCLIKDEATKGRQKKILLHIARREKLYARAINAGDFRTALAVLRDLGEIERIYPNPAEDLRRDIRKLKEKADEIEAQQRGSGAAPEITKAEGVKPLRFEGAATPTCRP